MKVCRTDAGNAEFFRCIYHGWTYSNEGKLIGVPFHREAYYGDLNRERWALFSVPRVETYRGLIFGCWDAEAISLKEYLGDLRWYLDIMLERPLGGLEVLPGVQKYVIKGNWKIPADNFASDSYHAPYTHASAFKLGVGGSRNLPQAPMYTIAFDRGHGIGAIAVEKERYKWDLDVAKRLGPEAVEYVEESYQRLQRRLSQKQAGIYALAFGNIFPNFSFNDFSALSSSGLYLWHPKGPDLFEAWQWCWVDRDAPKIVKERTRIDFTRVQSVSGFFGQDD